MPLSGYRLKQTRENRGYTQEELADLLHVSTLQIYRWETEKNDPVGDMLAKMAQVLRVSSDYLLGLVDEPNQQKQDADLSGMEIKLLTAFRNGEFMRMIRLIAEQSPSDMSNQTSISSSEPAIDG